MPRVLVLVKKKFIKNKHCSHLMSTNMHYIP